MLRNCIKYDAQCFLFTVYYTITCTIMGASKSRPKEVRRARETDEFKELSRVVGGDGNVSPSRSIPGSWRGRAHSSSSGMSAGPRDGNGDEIDLEWKLFEFGRFRAEYWQLFSDCAISIKQHGWDHLCSHPDRGCTGVARFRLSMILNEWRCWEHYTQEEEELDNVIDGETTWITFLTYQLCKQIFGGCCVEGLTQEKIKGLVQYFFHWTIQQNLYIDIPGKAFHEMHLVGVEDAKVCRAVSVTVIKTLHFM